MSGGSSLLRFDWGEHPTYHADTPAPDFDLVFAILFNVRDVLSVEEIVAFLFPDVDADSPGYSAAEMRVRASGTRLIAMGLFDSSRDLYWPRNWVLPETAA